MIVFVHGVPETASLWDKLRRKLERDSVALALPGFGCERPAEFSATKDDYVNWLSSQLERINPPIDLVGHDWGAGFTYRIATAQGHLVWSWAADVANIMHPDYAWHEFAKIWQTLGDGEAFFEGQLALAPEDRAPILESMGVPHEDAVSLMASNDSTMASCILDLYRSAMPNAYRDWRDAFGPTAARGLVLHPRDDPFGDEAMASEVASMLGAGFEALDGLGHWWALQDPATGVAVLERFWNTLDEP